MLKKLLFLSTAFVLAFSASAQTHKRRALVEEFTNASCGPCASQNPQFNGVLKANYDKVTAIKYQVNFPGYDPMNEQNPGEVDTRRGYYGVNAVPHGTVNGTNIANDCSAYDGSPFCLSATDVATAYDKLTPVTMSVTHALSANFDSVIINVSVTSDDALTGSLKLRVAVTEETINFASAPGSNGETEFFQVMRKMLPSPAGTTTGDFAAGETKTYTFAWKIGYAYDLNQLGAVVWLQNDGTKEVLQSERSLPVNNGVPDMGINIPGGNLFACTSGFSPKFTLTNTSDAALTSANLRWRVGTAPWNDLAWTGNLASGASETVTLDTAITQSGTLKLEVVPVNSNNGIQVNLVNALSTFNIKTLFGASAPTPFTNPFQTTPFPPTGWTGYNVGANGWKLATNAGSNSSRSARCNFFNMGAGQVATLTTPKIDLSTASGVTTLNFDHAYAYFNDQFFDSLRVEISTDCGDTWTTVFHDGKDGLATAPPFADPNVAWVPAATDWLENSIDISDFNGNPEVLVRFAGESGFGNNLHIDNLNITALVGVKELSLTGFSLQPNPTRDASQVRFGLDKPESIQLSVFNAMGVLVQSQNLGDLASGEHTVSLESGNLPAGSYRVVLQGKEGVTNVQWMVVK